MKEPASPIKTPQLFGAYFISVVVEYEYPDTRQAIVKCTSKENRLTRSLSR